MKKRIGRYINKNLVLEIRNHLMNAIIGSILKLTKNDYKVAYDYLAKDIKGVIKKIDEIIEEGKK
ncbi:MAG: hypothetical protein ACOC5T_08095 [Elusimicrobiota bacterium]